MSSSNAFGVHDHAAQFRGVRGSFLCAEAFGISSKCCFMALPLLHEGGGREDGREGGSERGSQQASKHATRRSKKMNRRHKSFFSCAIKKYFHPIKNYFRPIKNISFSFVAIKIYFCPVKNISFSFVAIKNYFRVIKNNFIWAN